MKTAGAAKKQVPLTLDDEARFWDKADIPPDVMTGCWRWTDKPDPSTGYGRFGVGGKGTGNYIAHRLAYTLARGPIPKGMVIDHLCRQRNCINPNHLEVTEHKTNTRRGLITKLKPEEVAIARRMLKAGAKIELVAVWFKVAKSTMNGIKYGKNWIDIKAATY